MHAFLAKSCIITSQPSYEQHTKMAVLEAATDISGTWVDCLKQCLLEVGWTDVSMTDVSGMSGHKVKEMLTSSA